MDKWIKILEWNIVKQKMIQKMICVIIKINNLFLYEISTLRLFCISS